MKVERRCETCCWYSHDPDYDPEASIGDDEGWCRGGGEYAGVLVFEAFVGCDEWRACESSDE